MAYLNLMLNNKADFILEYNDRSSGPSTLKRTDIDWSQSRVIFVAPEFIKYQQYAIGFKNLGIQLWEIHKYKNAIVTFNEVQSPTKKESITTITKSNPVARRVSEEIKVYTEDDHLSTVDNNIKELYMDLKSAILSLGKDIEIRPKKFYITFRRKQGFVGLQFLKSKSTHTVFFRRICKVSKRNDVQSFLDSSIGLLIYVFLETKFVMVLSFYYFD
jgi:hypothetical protein